MVLREPFSIAKTDSASVLSVSGERLNVVAVAFSADEEVELEEEAMASSKSSLF